jgi:hypothetical protein
MEYIIAFFYAFVVLVKTVTFGIGESRYQNSFDSLGYNTFRYNSLIDGNYVMPSNNNRRFMVSNPDLYIAACTCHENFFINYFYQTGRNLNSPRSFDSFSPEGNYIGYKDNSLNPLNEFFVSGGRSGRGLGGIRSGYSFFSIGDVKPYIVLGYVAYGGGRGYSPLVTEQNNIYLFSGGSFETISKGPSVGTNIEYPITEKILLLFQLHYMNLRGNVFSKSSAFNWTGNKVNEFYLDSQGGKIQYEGFESHIGFKFNALNLFFPYMGLVYTHFKTRYEMNESWKMTGNLPTVDFSIDKYLITHLNPPTFKAQDNYLGIRFNFEINLIPGYEAIGIPQKTTAQKNGFFW